MDDLVAEIASRKAKRVGPTRQPARRKTRSEPRRNRGVADRDAKDRADEAEDAAGGPTTSTRSAIERALDRKAALYEDLVHGRRVDEASRYDVDFGRKASECCDGNQSSRKRRRFHDGPAL